MNAISNLNASAMMAPAMKAQQVSSGRDSDGDND